VVLALTFLMVMVLTVFTGALVQLGQADLGNASHYLNKARSRGLAQAGVEHAIHRLTYDAGFHDAVTVNAPTGQYRFHFDTTKPDFSVNNLLGGGSATQRNSIGDLVASYRVDLVVVGVSGSVETRLHSVCESGLRVTKSAGSEGPLSIGAQSSVRGIRSLSDPTEVGGGLFSHFVSVSPTNPSVSVMSGAFSIGATSTVSAPPANGGTSITSGVPVSNQRSESQDKVPDLDVTRLVQQQQSALPLPAGLTPVGAGYEMTDPSITGAKKIDKDLVVRGDLQLNGASLYVKGNVTIYGGVVGEGSIFSDGDVKIVGGTSSLRTNQTSGAALYAQGTVELEGLDATGYLDSIISAHPSSPLGPAKAQLLTNLAPKQAAMSSAFPGERFAAVMEVGGMGTGGWLAQGKVAPDGSRGVTTTDRNDLLLTAAAVKTALGTSYAADAKANKIVRALEQYSYDNRGAFTRVSNAINDDYTLSGIPARTDTWDDNAFLGTPDLPDFRRWDLAVWDQGRARADGRNFGSLSFDHQARVLYGIVRRAAPLGGTSAAAADVAALTPLEVLHANQIKANAALHPLDMSWLGKSNFQGIVYSRGDLKISNDFTLYGSALSKGKIKITDRSELVYVEEYGRTLGVSGPLRTVWQNEQ
jgi:hypothetical protein